MTNTNYTICFLCRTDVRTYDISELYQFADQTGILERHRQMLSQPFQDSQVLFLDKTSSWKKTKTNKFCARDSLLVVSFLQN